jgi:hypothetical protein
MRPIMFGFFTMRSDSGRAVEPHDSRCEFWLDACHIGLFKAPDVRQELESEVAAGTPPNELRQLPVRIVDADLRRHVDEHAGGDCQSQRVGQRAHDDFGHEA